VGPRAGLDEVAKTKEIPSLPLPGIEFRSFNRSPEVSLVHRLFGLTGREVELFMVSNFLWNFWNQEERRLLEGVWRILHNERLHNLQDSPNIIMVIKPRRGWVRHVVRMREMGNGYKIFVGKPEGKRPLRKT
jgi:hypothetical protein